MSEPSYNKKPFSFGSDYAFPKESKLTNVPKISVPNEDDLRSLFDISQEACAIPTDGQTEQIIENKPEEIRNVLSRIEAIITDHKEAAKHLKVNLGPNELKIVMEALIDHAKGGTGSIQDSTQDEVHSYCPTRLFEELVEEPSNILYATRTGADSLRYDAMQPAFWIECLTAYLAQQ